jgi:uncharacterized membrane protein
MSNLVVFDFDGIHTADEVLNKLRSLQKEYLIDLEDACVVERENGGKIHIKQAVNLYGNGCYNWWNKRSDVGSFGRPAVHEPAC